MVIPQALPKPRMLLAALLLATATAAPMSRAHASTALDEKILVHREAAPSAQALLRADPARPGWIEAGTAAGQWHLVAGEPVAKDGACPPLLRHAFTPIQGGPPQSMCQYQGKVLLVVNTASQCGFTYQYEGLEALYRKYKDRGLVVVGFPSNDFGGQEPGTNKDIAEFCRTKYGVQFPMFEKQSVTTLADNAFYAELAGKTGDKPRWNFHKYLVDRQGQRVQSFASSVEPGNRDLVGTIERLLAERAPANRS
jgi:glutathione peroxidase